jgi:hypothetical protein
MSTVTELAKLIYFLEADLPRDSAECRRGYKRALEHVIGWRLKCQLDEENAKGQTKEKAEVF